MKFRFERTNCSYVDEALRDQRTYKSKEAKAEDRSKKRIRTRAAGSKLFVLL